MHEFDPTIDVVANDVAIGETITQAHLAVKNRQEKKRSTPIPSVQEVERKTQEWWKKHKNIGEYKQFFSAVGSL